MKFKENTGLGFVEISPPYNLNYTGPPLYEEEIENESNMVYGKGISVEPVKSVLVKITEPVGHKKHSKYTTPLSVVPITTFVKSVSKEMNDLGESENNDNNNLDTDNM